MSPFTALKPARFPWFDYSRYSFSLGLQGAAGTYLSGHTASEFDAAQRRMVVRGSMTEQVRTAYAKIGAILEAGGLSFGDVVRVVEYLRPEGIERYAEAAAARAEVFGKHQPVVNTVPVKSLLRPDAFLEVEVTAAAMAGLPAGAGAVYLPTVQPVDDKGRIIGAGDVVAQTQAILERAGRMLAALGLGVEHVVKTLDYLTPAGLAGYEGAKPQGRTGVVMPRLLHPEALIQSDFIATREPPVAVVPGAVRAGRLLFMSARGALDPATERVRFEGDVVAQAEYVYANILKGLEGAGAGAQNLVKTIEYVTPAALARYREVAGVRQKLLREPWPASTGLVCEALLRPGMQIAVDPLAVLA